jgi:hypothetical protein
MQLIYRVRFDDVQLSDWGNWPLPDKEVDNRLHQLERDVRFFLSDLGDLAALTKVEGARRADQKEWKLSVTTSLSLEDAAKAAEFAVGRVQMLLTPSD